MRLKKEVRMKALKVKAVALAFVFATGAITWGRNLATDEPGPRTSNRFLKEHQDIRTDLRHIELHRNEIASLKAELKADKKADRKMEVIMDKKEITKAKADLKRDKKYLAADKKDLRQDHALVIKEQRQEVADNRQALRAAKRDLRQSLREDNQFLVEQDAAQVSRLMARHEVSKMTLVEYKIDRNNDMIAVNEDIRATNMGLAAHTYAEDGQAYVSNWMLKE
jgi:hypothetical protein